MKRYLVINYINMWESTGIKISSSKELFDIKIEYIPSKSKTDLNYNFSVNNPKYLDMEGYLKGKTNIPCEGLFKGILSSGIIAYNEKIINMIEFYAKKYFKLTKNDIKKVVVLIEGYYQANDIILSGNTKGELDEIEAIDCEVSEVIEPIIYITDNNDKTHTYNNYIDNKFAIDYEKNTSIKLVIGGTIDLERIHDYIEDYNLNMTLLDNYWN